MRTSAEPQLLDRDVSYDWRQDARCVDYVGSVDFFPARGESVAEAKAVCSECRVRKQCLEYALRFDVLCGVWGGMSERERRQVRRERRNRARSHAN